MKEAYKGSLGGMLAEAKRDLDTNEIFYFGCKDIGCTCCPSRINGEKPRDYYGIKNCAVAKQRDIARRLREGLDGYEKEFETHKDAFGKDIKPGDRVWCIASKDQLGSICIGDLGTIEVRKGALIIDGFNEIGFARFGNSGYQVKTKYLSVEEPPKDHDGQHIYPGDTVYLRDGDWCNEYPLYGAKAGCKLTVEELNPVHDRDGVIRCSRGEYGTCFPKPDQVTHEEPKKHCKDCRAYVKDPDLTVSPGGPCLEKCSLTLSGGYYYRVREDGTACDKFKPRED